MSRENRNDAAIPEIWERNALNQFIDTVNNNDFPCLFAKKSVKNNSYIPFYFTDIHNEDLIHELIKDKPIKDRLYQPLVIFFKPDLEKNFTSQHDLAWHTINWIHANDPRKWPNDIPHDPNNTNWCFCFNDVQLFINISSVHHQIIRSRNLGSSLVFVINPLDSFDFVSGGINGMKILEQIRKRMAIYNKNGYIPYELGIYGNGKGEWQQYHLEEINSPRPNKCPFTFINKDE